MARIHGAATAGENLAGNINFYTMYIKTLDISTKLFEYFEKDNVKEKLIRMFISKPDLINQLRNL